MKNTYSKRLLEKAFRYLQKIRLDHEYIEKYHHYTVTKQTLQRARLTKSLRHNKEVYLFNIRQSIAKKWGLLIPIDPQLKLEKKDLYKKTLRRKSPFAQLIYSFGVDDNPLLLTYEQPRKRRKWKCKDTTELKYLCYHYKEYSGFSYRKLSVLFQKDHKTIAKWHREVEAWPSSTRDMMHDKITDENRMRTIYDSRHGWPPIFEPLTRRVDYV